MEDREKVFAALERCKTCDTSLLASDDGKKAYIDCEYTTGLYCRQDRVIADAIELLKEQPQVVRCKDCKKRDSWECWQYFFGRIKIPDDWYCADGESW